MPYSLVSSKNNVFYLSLHSALLKGYSIRVTELDATTGKQIGQPTVLSSDGDVITEDSILHFGSISGIPLVIWTDKSLKTLKIHAIGTKRTASVKIPTKSGDSAEEIIIHSSGAAAAPPHFLTHYRGANSHWAEVHHVDISTGAATKAFDLPKVAGKGAFSTSSQASNLYFTRHTAFENIVVSSTGPTVLSQWNVYPEGRDGIVDHQNILHAASEVLPKGDSTYAVRSALALQFGDWKLVRNGEPLWIRSEGLAGTIAAAFFEIPKEEDLARELAAEGMHGPLTAYLHRIKRHIRNLQFLPDRAEGVLKRLLGGLLGDNVMSEDRYLRRDGFGFQKIILIATERGRLAALDTGNQGKVLWNVQAATPKVGDVWHVLSIQAEDGAALVRARGGEFLRIVPKTGEILQHQSAAIDKSLMMSVPVVDASGRHVLMPVNDDGSIGALPKADFALGNIVVTEGKDGLVRGWKVDQNAKLGLLWLFTPASGQILYSVDTRPRHDPVASIGKALGDRNVLYKYLNPNLLLVTTTSNKTSTATFYIIDAISGAVLYSVNHPGIDLSQPIVATMSENWFTYSLYAETTAVTQDTTQIDNQKLTGHQLVVFELYESPHLNDRGPLDSFSNSSSLHPMAAEENDTPASTPHVISQMYLLPGPVSSISVTSTLQGITTRSLLCVLPELNSLVAISRAFIDARRPVGRDPTALEAEEGLFRYSPIIDFEPKWILNHKRDIMSISNVVTSPSLLESTSLIFAFGKLDLFGTRLAPIGLFDILGKGFGKLQLVMTVVALAVGTAFVAPFVSVSYNHISFTLDEKPTDITVGT